MNSNRAGAYVSSARATRASAYISVNANQVNINGEDWRNLGFTRPTAQDSAEVFVDALNDLSNHIITRQGDLNPYAADLDQQLDATLRPDAHTTESCLRALRDVGSQLRSALSKEVEEDFKYIGFNFLNKFREATRGGVKVREVCEEPSLAFSENVKDAATAPLLWEMMYEGEAYGEPDWRQFWGFRVPVAYWGAKVRTSRVSLDHGVFAAAYESLPFAGQEVEVLTGRIGDGVKYESLQEVLRARAKQQFPGEDLNWNGDDWLAKFFQLQQEQNKLTQHGVSDWKRRAWVEIFKNRPSSYGLVHFACHCTPGAGSEFLSRLDLKVGGEEMCLEAGFISAALSRDNVRRDDPGPLVFLNACGTGQVSPKQRPPGFPLMWIKNQGALAVLVTLCPVPDYFAHKFASRFYEILTDAMARPDTRVGRRNRYVAEALLLTRRYFMKRYNNPLGLAYLLYGTRDVHVEASFPSPGGDA
jgi:hypothetical protein